MAYSPVASPPGDPVSMIPGMNIRYWKCPHCDFKVVKRTAMEFHQQVIHPDGPAMSKITTIELEMDPRAPFPEVQQHYKIKIEGLQNHNFGSKFINLHVSFNNEPEDEPITLALKIMFKILNNIYALLTRNADSEDLVRFILTSDQIIYLIEVPFLTKEESSVKCIMDQVERVLQSYRDFRLKKCKN